MVKNCIFQEADFEVEARRGAQRLKKRLLVVAARYDQQADRGASSTAAPGNRVQAGACAGRWRVPPRRT